MHFSSCRNGYDEGQRRAVEGSGQHSVVAAAVRAAGYSSWPSWQHPHDFTEPTCFLQRAGVV